MPAHPAPSGSRWGNGQSEANRSSGMKKGQATKPRVMLAKVKRHCNGGVELVPPCNEMLAQLKYLNKKFHHGFRNVLPPGVAVLESNRSEAHP